MLSVYWIVFFVITICSIIEFFFLQNREKYANALILVLLMLVALLAVFRYGEGSDYPNYQLLYQAYRTEAGSIMEYYDHWGLRDVAFFFPSFLLSRLGLPYEVYLGLITLIEIPFLYLFLKRYCSGFRCMALLLLYPSYYFIYLLSSLREGLVIAIFLGAMLPMIEKKKWIRYFLMAVLCVLIHRTAVVYLLCPVILKLKTRLMEVIAACAACFGIIYQVVLHYRTGMTTFSSMSYLFRIILLVVVIFCFYHAVNNRTSFETMIYKMFLIGMFCFFVLSWNPFAASKMSDVLRFTDVILVVMFLREIEKKKSMLCLIALVAFSAAMFGKNLDSRIRSGLNANVHIWNYPYVTVFNREDIIRYQL